MLRVEEVTLLLRAATAPKYKAAFATAYGAGLRASEVVALKVGDVDFQAHAAARRARQGPPCNAVATAAQTAARLVAGGAATQPATAGKLAVPPPQPGRSGSASPTADERRILFNQTARDVLRPS